VCGAHVWKGPVSKGEMYRRDEQKGDVWVYVFTDPRLGERLPADEAKVSEPERAPAA
jgi:hypothetical protein